MADILSDRQLSKLIGKVIIDGDPDLLSPNGIKLRLGRHVFFHSTEEEFKLEEGKYLQIKPGETISFSSFERIDFSRETIEKIFPNSSLMALVTPTTTMMREGISNVATKVDAGFKGVLNWSLRNGSSKDAILKYKEEMFKLMIFKLTGDENPEKVYGDSEGDTYQDTEGINYSKRTIPAHIPKSKVVQSSFGKINPKAQLKEAGYPFDYISTELIELQGKFEIVSTDVRLIKDEFETKTQELKEKITDSEKSLFGKVKLLFNDQFIKIGSIVIGAITVLYGILVILKEQNVSDKSVSIIAIVVGVLVVVIAFLLTRKYKS